MNRRDSSSLVYSTDGGRACPACRQPVAACNCASSGVLSTTSDGVVLVSRESKGRGGKTVTVLRGLALAPDALAALGKRLRQVCGTGGTAKEGELELQGDHAERVLAWLVREGRSARRAGG